MTIPVPMVDPFKELMTFDKTWHRGAINGIYFQFSRWAISGLHPIRTTRLFQFRRHRQIGMNDMVLFFGVRYHVGDDTVSFLTRGTPAPAGPTNWGVVLRTVGESLVGATTGHRSNVARSTKQPQQYFTTTTTTTNNNKHWK